MMCMVILLCSMFILLRGQVSVYDDGATSTAGDASDNERDTEAATSGVATKTDDEFRQQLGALVVTLNGK